MAYRCPVVLHFDNSVKKVCVGSSAMLEWKVVPTASTMSSFIGGVGSSPSQNVISKYDSDVIFSVRGVNHDSQNLDS